MIGAWYNKNMRKIDYREKCYYYLLKKQQQEYCYERGKIEKWASERIYKKDYKFEDFVTDVYSQILIDKNELEDIYYKLLKVTDKFIDE